jgi:lysine biosynthesis protein LysW
MQRAGGADRRRALESKPTAASPSPEERMPTVPVRTPHGVVDVDPAALELGELVVSDDGVELEVVALDPLRFEPAPQEDEDWGE